MNIVGRLGVAFFDRKFVMAAGCVGQASLRRILGDVGRQKRLAIEEAVRIAGLAARFLHLRGCALCDLGRLADAEVPLADSARLDPWEKLYEEKTWRKPVLLS